MLGMQMNLVRADWERGGRDEKALRLRQSGDASWHEHERLALAARRPRRDISRAGSPHRAGT
jgi:hypothetical protein